MSLALNAAFRLLNPTPGAHAAGSAAGTAPVLPSTVASPASSSAASPAAPGGGVNPNFYLNAINSDPLYAQDKADLSAQGIQDSQGAAAGIVRALVARGIVPDLATAAQTLGLSQNVLDFLKNNVDFGRAATLAKQATESGVSQEAQLQHQHELNVGNIKDRLAARGIASSGASAFDLGEEASQNKVQRFQADQQTADFINGAIAAFAQAQRARQQQLRQSASDAAMRQQQLLGSASPTTGQDEAQNLSGDFVNYLQALVQAAKTGRAVAV